MIENYIKYLDFINKKLDCFFKAQSPYIFCKKGCTKCCEDGEYPFSKIEIDYILQGFSKLPKKTQKIILENVNKVKSEKQKCKKIPFMYKCPFLIKNKCSVYEYRGLICRTFGLIAIPNKINNKPQIPFCAYYNLNYSNVIEKETGIISTEKFKKLNIIQVPLAYNVSYKFLTDKDFEELYNFKFGDKKALIDWF